MYVVEWRSSHHGFDLPPTEHFYIRDWGKPCPLDDLHPKWHNPDQTECEFVDEILREFLLPELDLLKEFMAGKATLNR